MARLAAAIVAMSLAVSGAAWACENDTECKGDRVCEGGKCVTPSAKTKPSSGGVVKAKSEPSAEEGAARPASTTAGAAGKTPPAEESSRSFTIAVRGGYGISAKRTEVSANPYGWGFGGELGGLFGSDYPFYFGAFVVIHRGETRTTSYGTSEGSTGYGGLEIGVQRFANPVFLRATFGIGRYIGSSVFSSPGDSFSGPRTDRHDRGGWILRMGLTVTTPLGAGFQFGFGTHALVALSSTDGEDLGIAIPLMVVLAKIW